MMTSDFVQLLAEQSLNFDLAATAANATGDDSAAVWNDMLVENLDIDENDEETAAIAARTVAAAKAAEQERLSRQLVAGTLAIKQLVDDSAGSTGAKRSVLEETIAEYRRALTLSTRADGFTAAKVRVAAPTPELLLPDESDLRLFGPRDWIWDSREAANGITDEDLRARQEMIAAILPGSPSAPPAKGANRVFVTPAGVDRMRIQQWMLYHTPQLHTTNAVATADFCVPINAFTLVNRISGACFNPRCFAAVKLRIHGSTHMIFSEGSIVCTGSKSVDHARIACIDIAQMLMRVGIQAQFSRFQLRNVVSTGSCGFEVDLAALEHAYPINAHYVPSCFPGLTFRLPRCRLVVIIFKSGCCILAGVRSRAEALIAWTWFHGNVLWNFQVKKRSYYASDTEYGRKMRQEESMIASVCESIRDVTQSLLTTAIAQSQTRDCDTQLPVDDYYAALRAMTEQIGDKYSRPEHTKISLEEWLQADLRRHKNTV